MPLLCFASPKGGVGKTTLAANTAFELVRLGHRVIALDLDPQNTLRLHFGVPLHDGAGLMPVLREGGPWRQALREMPSGVRLLPYGRLGTDASLALGATLGGNPGLLAAPVREILADPHTILVVDTPPGPSPMLAAIAGAVDVMVAVLLADATSVCLIPALEAEFARHGGSAGRLLFAVNQVDLRSRLARATTDTMRRHFGGKLLGIVYRDEHAAEAIAAQLPIAVFAPGSRAAQDVAALAATLAGQLDETSAVELPHVALAAAPVAYAERWRA